jgi:hypothetical protein
MSVEPSYQREERARPIIFPLLLIAVGAVLLGLNLGYISWQSVRSALQYWPVIFIVLGIEALITRRAPWGALLLALIVLAVSSSNGWMRPPWRAQPAQRAVSSSPQQQALNGASRALVNVSVGGAQVQLGATHSPGILASWTGGVSDHPDYRVRDGVGRLDLELTRGRGFPGFWRMNPFANDSNTPDSSEISVLLATGLPMELDAHLGASQATVDLRELQITRLTLDAGASYGTVYLPSLADSSTVTIRGGASNLEIVVPEGVRARITTEGGLSSLNVNPERFTTVGEGSSVYETRAADPGAHTLNVNLRLGASSVNVR